MKWSYFLIWDETIVWEHWMFLLNNENTEYFTLHLKSWMIFFLFVCLKSTVLIVDCFHLLVLYAIFILTSPKLCKGKKRRERSGDCTATKPSLLCSLSTPDWKKKVPQKRSGFRRDKEARWYISGVWGGPWMFHMSPSFSVISTEGSSYTSDCISFLREQLPCALRERM